MGQTISVSSSLIKPRALQPGDTIAIISPAGATPIADPKKEAAKTDPFEQGVSLLEQVGFRVKLMPNARQKNLYLAGTDQERLSDLHAAFQEPSVQGILCARGGYGCTRLLSALDFDLIRKNPKPLIGYSDITALLNPIYQQCGLLGFYGPMLTSNLIYGEPYSQSELTRMITGQVKAGETIPNRDAYHCFQEGTVEAPLMGGNLSLLTALCGTSYQPQTQGHILFIEDWKEKYYSLDRQFQQLKMAGLLEHIQGLLLCDFSEIDPEPEKSLPNFLHDLVMPLVPTGTPVGYGFSVGHGEQTATLPIGCRVEFNAAHGRITLLESPVAT